MSERAIDAFIRQTAQSVSRRVSLATLSGAGLAAIFGGSLTAEAKKKNKKKKKSDPFKLCQPQVQQCQVGLPPLDGSPEQVLCCESFATCDVTQFFLCLVAAGAS